PGCVMQVVETSAKHAKGKRQRTLVLLLVSDTLLRAAAGVRELFEAAVRKCQSSACISTSPIRYESSKLPRLPSHVTRHGSRKKKTSCFSIMSDQIGPPIVEVCVPFYYQCVDTFIQRGDSIPVSLPLEELAPLYLQHVAAARKLGLTDINVAERALP